MNATSELQGLSRVLSSDGFAWLPALDPSVSLDDIVKTIGVYSGYSELKSAHRISPVAIEDSAPNLYSGNFGLGEYPMHTDMAHWAVPPRFMALRCVKGDSSVCTNIALIDDLLIGVKQGIVDKASFIPRKRNGRNLTLLPFRSDCKGSVCYRWDQLFIKPSNDSAKEISANMMQAGRVSKSIALSSQGDTLIIDNWRVLHGRSAVSPSATNRIIERAYLDQVLT